MMYVELNNGVKMPTLGYEYFKLQTLKSVKDVY